MKTINELRKHTSSLQSMMMMNGTENNIPEVGKFVTTFYHTDRRSEKIIGLKKNKGIISEIHTEGRIYYMNKRGLQLMDWENKKYLIKNARITNKDLSYWDPSF